jgi:hypothetical protein
MVNYNKEEQINPPASKGPGGVKRQNTTSEGYRNH